MSSYINGTAYWAHIITPNYKFREEGEWSIDVCNLDEKNIKIAEADGLTVKKDAMDSSTNGERKQFVTIKAKTTWGKSGDAKTPPKVVDADRNPFTETKLGNGSLVNVKYHTYENKPYGIFGDLEAVQVLNFVPAPEQEDDTVDGFPIVKDGYKSTSNEDIDFPQVS